MSVFSGASNPGLIFQNFTPTEVALLIALGLLPVDATKAIVKSGTTAFTQVSLSGSGFTKLTTASTVNGINTSFTFSQAPTYIVSDGVWMQALDNNGATNWSGTTTVTMSIPPQSSIWGFV